MQGGAQPNGADRPGERKSALARHQHQGHVSPLSPMAELEQMIMIRDDD